MIKRDFYSGEISESPPTNLIDQSSVDQNNALIQNNICYSIEPNQRFNNIIQQQQQNYQLPQSMYSQPQYMGGYMQMPNSFQNNSFSGSIGNPAFNMMNNGSFQFRDPRFNQPTERVTVVPGYSISGNKGIFAPDIMDQLNDLQIQMMVEKEEADIENRKRMQGMFNYNGMNYYGMQYYNGGADAVERKYRTKVQEIVDQGNKRRIEFNKKLSMIAHSYRGEEIDEQELEDIYSPHTIITSAEEVQVEQMCNKFNNMIPFNNAHLYAAHFNECRQMYNLYPGDPQNFEKSLNMIEIYDKLQASLERQRDGSRLYDSDTYKRYLRQKICERKGILTPSDMKMATINNTYGGIPPHIANNNAIRGIDPNRFPTLADCGTLMDDGTIKITAPSWIAGGSPRQIEVNGAMEAHFEENRNAFLNSIYNQNNGG